MDLWAFVQRNWLLLLTLAVLIAFLGAHVIWYIHPSDIRSAAELQQRVSSGRPVVEFYSNL